jgi:hypothetical protein
VSSLVAWSTRKILASSRIHVQHRKQITHDTFVHISGLLGSWREPFDKCLVVEKNWDFMIHVEVTPGLSIFLFLLFYSLLFYFIISFYFYSFLFLFFFENLEIHCLNTRQFSNTQKKI